MGYELTWKPSSVLITGGAGFFGRGFAKRCLEMGVPRVCIYSRDEAKHAAMRAEMPNNRLRFLIGDVRDRQRLERAMSGCDLVVHAAALKRVEVGEYDAEEMSKTNVDGTRNVVEAARRANVERVVYLSTDKAFQPVNAYGASKLLGEKIVLAANNSSGAGGPVFHVTRYGNVAGSTGSVIPTWREAMAAGRPVHVRDSRATRFWMTLEEAIDLVFQAASVSQGGGLWIPKLPAYRLGDLAEAMGVYRGPFTTGPSLNQGEKLHEGMEDGNTSDLAERMSVEQIKEELAHV